MADAEALPQLEFIFSAHVTVDPPLELGDMGKGGRRIVPITGGEFSGPQLRGTVLPGAPIGKLCGATAWPSLRRVIRCAPTMAP